MSVTQERQKSGSWFALSAETDPISDLSPAIGIILADRISYYKKIGMRVTGWTTSTLYFSEDRSRLELPNWYTVDANGFLFSGVESNSIQDDEASEPYYLIVSYEPDENRKNRQQQLVEARNSAAAFQVATVDFKKMMMAVEFLSPTYMSLSIPWPERRDLTPLASKDVREALTTLLKLGFLTEADMVDTELCRWKLYGLVSSIKDQNPSGAPRLKLNDRDIELFLAKPE